MLVSVRRLSYKSQCSYPHCELNQRGENAVYLLEIAAFSHQIYYCQRHFEKLIEKMKKIKQAPMRKWTDPNHQFNNLTAAVDIYGGRCDFLHKVSGPIYKIYVDQHLICEVCEAHLPGLVKDLDEVETDLVGIWTDNLET